MNEGSANLDTTLRSWSKRMALSAPSGSDMRSLLRGDVGQAMKYLAAHSDTKENVELIQSNLKLNELMSRSGEDGSSQGDGDTGSSIAKHLQVAAQHSRLQSELDQLQKSLQSKRIALQQTSKSYARADDDISQVRSAETFARACEVKCRKELAILREFGDRLEAQLKQSNVGQKSSPRNGARAHAVDGIDTPQLRAMRSMVQTASGIFIDQFSQTSSSMAANGSSAKADDPVQEAASKLPLPVWNSQAKEVQMSPQDWVANAAKLLGEIDVHLEYAGSGQGDEASAILSADPRKAPMQSVQDLMFELQARHSSLVEGIAQLRTENDNLVQHIASQKQVLQSRISLDDLSEFAWARSVAAALGAKEEVHTSLQELSGEIESIRCARDEWEQLRLKSNETQRLLAARQRLIISLADRAAGYSAYLPGRQADVRALASMVHKPRVQDCQSIVQSATGVLGSESRQVRDVMPANLERLGDNSFRHLSAVANSSETRDSRYDAIVKGLELPEDLSFDQVPLDCLRKWHENNWQNLLLEFIRKQVESSGKGAIAKQHEINSLSRKCQAVLRLQTDREPSVDKSLSDLADTLKQVDAVRSVMADWKQQSGGWADTGDTVHGKSLQQWATKLGRANVAVANH